MSVRKVVNKRKPRGKSKRGGAKTGLPKKLPPTNAFQPGNTLWSQRVRSGRERFFKDPLALLQKFQEYVQWAESNPIMVSEKSSSQGFAGLTEVPYRRPITVSAFCVIIGCNEDFLRNFRADVRKTPALADFAPVIDEIYQYVEDQLFEGASINQFNANLISRKLGLAEKTDVTSKGEAIAQPSINIYNTAPPFAEAERDVDKERK
jgi:hypothetical protein